MGNKGWSVLFGVSMAACAAGFGIAPFVGWWMPEGVSTHAADVDFLWYVILYITAFFFFLTEGILVAFMWLYASNGDGKRPVSASTEVPGFIKPIANILYDQHRVELAWTFVPAVILLYIAFAQVNTWANIKYTARNQAKPGEPSQQVAVSARQFEWRMRYPGSERFEMWMKESKPSDDFASFGKVPQASDVYVVNEMHVWKGQAVVVHLSSRDVIHSLNLPNFRVKQDALPGKMIPVFFTPTKANTAFHVHKKRYIDGMDPSLENDRLKGEQDYTKLSDALKKAKDELQDALNKLKGFEEKETKDLQKIKELTKLKEDLTKLQENLAKEQAALVIELDNTVYKADTNYLWDIPCAELCGWGHYRMIGRVYVHKDRADFAKWLDHAEKYNRQRTGDR